MFTRHEHQNLSLARDVLTRAECHSLAPPGCCHRGVHLWVYLKIPVPYYDQPQIQNNAVLASLLADNIFGVVE